MELTLTRMQRQYLDRKGLLNATQLQKTYRKSVQDQQTVIKKAAKLRKKAA